MICRPCRKAGTLNAMGFGDIAEAGHEQCEQPTNCPCQHRTGTVIRPESN